MSVKSYPDAIMRRGKFHCAMQIQVNIDKGPQECLRS